MKNVLVVVSVFFLFWSCNNNTSVKQSTPEDNNPDGLNTANAFSVVNPINYASYKIGDEIPVKLSLTDSTLKIDSVQVYLGNTRISVPPTSLNFSIKTGSELLGKQTLSIISYFNNKTHQAQTLELMLLSDIVPASLAYKVINNFPHSGESFTEGLLFDGTYLYEGTGEKGRSKVMKIELKTGKILQDLSIAPDEFGEGIVIIGDKLYQLTYQSNTGFVYNKNTFSLIRKFKYPVYTEGWGLTTDGKDLILSNGTDRIMVWDTTYMSIKREIKVCDNFSAVDSLNELEYVNGVLYANIWQTSKIAKIDFATGKVLGYLNLANIVKNGDEVNELNGIAYNKTTGNFYVTGKEWKHLFEIKLDK